MLLKDFEGFSVDEISELLDISESNVKIRIHRGRIKLRNELSDYFYPSERGN
jgi:RNA polymerase sigma-70 factor (ECF subfamily)